MKTNKFLILTLTLVGALLTANCSNDDDDDMTNPNPPTSPDFSGTFMQKDVVGRPGINTVFVASGAPKDAFNMTTPSTMGTTYQPVFEARLLALNPAYTTNALGMDAATFTGALATDVLNVSMSGTTTFFDGTNVLTGRRPSDDVIDTELLLIFGGPSGGDSPQLTSDNVDSNDKAFSPSFPYLASPW
ncbi:MAG TPA: DUF4331 family protein [Flavobacterium sp.]|jgi:hypothetical protein